MILSSPERCVTLKLVSHDFTGEYIRGDTQAKFPQSSITMRNTRENSKNVQQKVVELHKSGIHKKNVKNAKSQYPAQNEET